MAVLTYHVNLQLSTRKTAHALKEIHGITISHTMVANYAMTAASVIKPFVDTYDYKPSNILSADETYIKKLGVKRYVWIIMDACKKSILGYQVSDSRSIGPCVLAMRMAFEKFEEFPVKHFDLLLMATVHILSLHNFVSGQKDGISMSLRLSDFPMMMPFQQSGAG